MSQAQLPVLNFADGAEAVTACIVTNQVPFMRGSPGIAKTALVRIVAEAVDMPCVTMTMTNYEASDIGGLPTKELDSAGRATVVRVPFKQLREAISKRVLLFLDEISSIERSVEGPTMRLALERFAGDDHVLHPEARIVLAGNNPDETPKGRALTAAMTNRLVMLNVVPSAEETYTYFYDGKAKANEKAMAKVQAVAARSSEELQKLIEQENRDWAATMMVMPDLVTLSPPEASRLQGAPWGSPRAWEIGLAAYAALGRPETHGKTDMVGYAVLSGAVGPISAGAYLTIRELRKQLPTVNAIVNNPLGVEVPADRDHELAAISLLPRVYDQDPGAAWIYGSRLSQEMMCAAGVLLLRAVGTRPPYHDLSRSKFKAQASKAFTAMLGTQSKIIHNKLALSEQRVTEMLAEAIEKTRHGAPELLS